MSDLAALGEELIITYADRQINKAMIRKVLFLLSEAEQLRSSTQLAVLTTIANKIHLAEIDLQIVSSISYKAKGYLLTASRLYAKENFLVSGEKHAPIMPDRETTHDDYQPLSSNGRVKTSPHAVTVRAIDEHSSLALLHQRLEKQHQKINRLAAANAHYRAELDTLNRKLDQNGVSGQAAAGRASTDALHLNRLLFESAVECAASTLHSHRIFSWAHVNDANKRLVNKLPLDLKIHHTTGTIAFQPNQARTTGLAGKHYHFDFVTSTTTQLKLQAMAAGLAVATRKGESSLVICNGPTGSGKSHFLFSSTEAFVVQAISVLCQLVSQAAHPDLRVEVSAIEEYQGKLFDLFTERRELKNSKASSRSVTSRSEIDTVLRTALHQRSQTSTKINETSSRGHLLCTARLVGLAPHHTSTIALHNPSMNFLDLAGSEDLDDAVTWQSPSGQDKSIRSSTRKSLIEAKSIKSSRLSFLANLASLRQNEIKVAAMHDPLSKHMEKLFRLRTANLMLVTCISTNCEHDQLLKYALEYGCCLSGKCLSSTCIGGQDRAEDIWQEVGKIKLSSR